MHVFLYMSRFIIIHLNVDIKIKSYNEYSTDTTIDMYLSPWLQTHRLKVTHSLNKHHGKAGNIYAC